MKAILFLSALLLLVSCTSSQRLLIRQVDKSGTEASPEDSTLRVLQSNSQLLLIFVNENFLFSRVRSYNILAYHNGKWTAILYGAGNMIRPGSGLPETPVTYDSFAVSQQNCDSIQRYLLDNRIWAVPGDDGKHFCSDTLSNCTLKNGTRWRLLIMTPGKMIDRSYYAPEFFEKCCPGNPERKIFIEACKKIEALLIQAAR